MIHPLDVVLIVDSCSQQETVYAGFDEQDNATGGKYMTITVSPQWTTPYKETHYRMLILPPNCQGNFFSLGHVLWYQYVQQ